MEERRRGPRRLLVRVAHTWMPLPVGEWAIGRAPESDIRIDDDRVSRRHAVVRALPSGGWELADGGSLNGIWLDGRQVQRVSVPAGGLTVRFGGRDGVLVRLLPDGAGVELPDAEGLDAPEGAAEVHPSPGPAPVPGTSPVGVRFEEVTPEWSGWSQAEPEEDAAASASPSAPGARLRAFVRKVGRRDG